MVIGIVDKNIKSDSYHFNFIVFLKDFQLFKVPATLYYDPKHNKLYDKFLSISKGLMSFMNVYAGDRYHIDSMIALRHHSQYTKVKQFGHKILIFHSIKAPTCNIKTGSLIKLIQFSCKTSHYKALDCNPNYKTMDVNTIKPITLAHLNILKNIIHVDNSMTKDDWQLLKKIRVKNEKRQRSTKSLLVSNAKGLNRV